MLVVNAYIIRIYKVHNGLLLADAGIRVTIHPTPARVSESLPVLDREIINHENCINELRFTNYYLIRIIGF